MAESDPARSSSGSKGEAATDRFKCEGCGAEQRYDAGIGKLRCDFCGAEREVPRGAGVIEERDLFAGIEALPQGLGAVTDTVSRCKECGAAVHFNDRETGASTTATSCTFCGSASVLEQTENKKLLRPESLVPFAIDKKRANEEFGRWLKKLWFRPGDLRQLAKVKDLAGVYVPFWTYDAHVDSQWTAEAGYYYYVTEEYEATENGERVTRTREVRHTRWESAWGQRADDYDDVLVCASVGLPGELADSLRSFDTSQLVPYTPGYLAGWRAEEYAVALEDGFEKAREKIDEAQLQRCGADVPGDTHRALGVSSTYSGLTWKHVLLPVWIAAYRYRGEIYRFLVNGQTGEVQGKAPYSWLKITLTIALVATLLAIAILLASQSG